MRFCDELRYSATALALLLLSTGIASGEETLYVLEDRHGLTMIDQFGGAQREPIHSVLLDQTLSITPDGSLAYVGYSDGLAVVDLSSRRIVTILDLRGRAEDIVMSPDGRRAYVLADDLDVIVVDVESTSVIDRIPLGVQPTSVRPHRLAISADGSRLLALCNMPDFAVEQTHVAVIDTATHTVIDGLTIEGPSELAAAAFRFSDATALLADTRADHLSVLNIPFAPLDPPTSVVDTFPIRFPVRDLAAARGAEIAVATGISEGRGIVSVLNSTSGELVGEVDLPTQSPKVAVNDAGTRAYVTLPDQCAIGVIDTQVPQVIDTVTLLSQPIAIAISDTEATETPAPTSTPSPVITPGAARLCAYVAQGTGGTVSIIDTATRSLAGAMSIEGARRVSLSPDGETLLIGRSGSPSMVVVQTATHRVVGDFPALIFAPSGWAAFTGGGATALLPLTSECHTGAMVDVATRRVLDFIPLNEEPQTNLTWNNRAVVVTPDGSRAYVRRDAFPPGLSELVAVDLDSRQVIGRIDDPPLAGLALAISPDGASVYVPLTPTDTGNGTAWILVVDTATNEARSVISFPDATDAVATVLVASPDGERLYAGHDEMLSVFDTATEQLIETVGLGAGLSDLAFTPDGDLLYAVVNERVDSMTLGRVRLIDPETLAVIDAIELEHRADRVAIGIAPNGCSAPATPTATFTNSATQSATSTPTATGTHTASPSATQTSSPTTTWTASPTASLSPTPTPTSTPTTQASTSPTSTPTSSPEPSGTPTHSPVSTATRQGGGGNGCSLGDDTHAGESSAAVLFLGGTLLALMTARSRRRNTSKPTICRRIARVGATTVLLVHCGVSSPSEAAAQEVGCVRSAPRDGITVYLDDSGRPVVPDLDAAPEQPFVQADPSAQGAGAAADEDRPLPNFESAPGGGEMIILDDRFRYHSWGDRTGGGDVSVECTRTSGER